MLSDIVEDTVEIQWTVVSRADFQSRVDELHAHFSPDVYYKREDGWTLLHEFSAYAEGLSSISKMLELDFPVNEQDESGWTALHEAAQEGHISICRTLLHHGANATLTRSSDNLTPLMAAAEVGDELTTAWFLKQPATWSHTWDVELFTYLLETTPRALKSMLDDFARVLNYTRRGKQAVEYRQVRSTYLKYFDKFNENNNCVCLVERIVRST